MARATNVNVIQCSSLCPLFYHLNLKDRICCEVLAEDT